MAKSMEDIRRELKNYNTGYLEKLSGMKGVSREEMIKKIAGERYGAKDAKVVSSMSLYELKEEKYELERELRNIRGDSGPSSRGKENSKYEKSLMNRLDAVEEALDKKKGKDAKPMKLKDAHGLDPRDLDNIEAYKTKTYIVDFVWNEGVRGGRKDFRSVEASSPDQAKAIFLKGGSFGIPYANNVKITKVAVRDSKMKDSAESYLVRVFTKGKNGVNDLYKGNDKTKALSVYHSACNKYPEENNDVRLFKITNEGELTESRTPIKMRKWKDASIEIPFVIEYSAGVKKAKVTLKRKSKEEAIKSFNIISKNAYEPFGVKKEIENVYSKGNDSKPKKLKDSQKVILGHVLDTLDKMTKILNKDAYNRSDIEEKNAQMMIKAAYKKIDNSRSNAEVDRYVDQIGNSFIIADKEYKDVKAYGEAKKKKFAHDSNEVNIGGTSFKKADYDKTVAFIKSLPDNDFSKKKFFNMQHLINEKNVDKAQPLADLIKRMNIKMQMQR